jgi:hypothetical protein
LMVCLYVCVCVFIVLSFCLHFVCLIHFIFLVSLFVILSWLFHCKISSFFWHTVSGGHVATQRQLQLYVLATNNCSWQLTVNTEFGLFFSFHHSFSKPRFFSHTLKRDKERAWQNGRFTKRQSPRERERHSHTEGEIQKHRRG